MIRGHIKFLQDLHQSWSIEGVTLPPSFPQAIRHVLSGPVPMAKFGHVGEAAQFTRWSILAAEELAKIAACLQWCRDQMVVGLAFDPQFVSDLELRGGQEDLAVLEYVHGAANSIDNLD